MVANMCNFLSFAHSYAAQNATHNSTLKADCLSNHYSLKYFVKPANISFFTPFTSFAFAGLQYQIGQELAIFLKNVPHKQKNLIWLI